MLVAMLQNIAQHQYVCYSCVLLYVCDETCVKESVCDARLLAYIVYRRRYIMKKLGVCWMYRRRFQRRVTSRCRRGPTVCRRNTSVSGVPRTDLRTGSCNHPRSSSPPSQFTPQTHPRSISFLQTFLPFSLSISLSLTLCLAYFIHCLRK